MAHDTVLALATEYASLLPFDIAVRTQLEGSDASDDVWRRITEPELPWRIKHPSPAARQRALNEYCERTFGFTPLGSINLDLPVAG
ncbi:hypothetical protein [Leucobacter coleopterorum]|uniref:hypothetical protein n=1 Tax=Leucobacter coleopterorum TaxID=2714933 RepID=UPI001FCADC77|nr:hypothetical protein [Leucobacter coleopterorum]